jgi:hypothetical protein
MGKGWLTTVMVEQELGAWLGIVNSKRCTVHYQNYRPQPRILIMNHHAIPSKLRLEYWIKSVFKVAWNEYQ